MFVFHVERHPDYLWYEQCITFNSFSSRHLEVIYVFFGMFMMYGLPLLVIIFSYVSILGEIYRRSVEGNTFKIKVRNGCLVLTNFEFDITYKN